MLLLEAGRGACMGVWAVWAYMMQRDVLRTGSLLGMRSVCACCHEAGGQRLLGGDEDHEHRARARRDESAANRLGSRRHDVMGYGATEQTKICHHVAFAANRNTTNAISSRCIPSHVHASASTGRAASMSAVSAPAEFGRASTASPEVGPARGVPSAGHRGLRARGL